MKESIVAPMERDVFYDQRDSRTSRSVQQDDYRDARVALSADAEEASEPAGQVAFLLAANLLARWCRHLRFTAPAIPVHDSLGRFVGRRGIPNLPQQALAVARAADPFGDFDVVRDVASASLHLQVGRGPSHGAYRIVGRGWRALAGAAVDEAGPGESGPLFGAMLAAAIGTAGVFRAALGQEDLPDRVVVSLWDLRTGPDALNGPRPKVASVGNCCIVGCGAVGSAFAFLLPLSGLTGSICLLDGDLVEVSNLNRSPLFTLRDVGDAKVDVVARYLRRCGYRVEAQRRWFDEAIASGSVFHTRPDVLIPTANERNVREAIQHQVPPLQVYGTTGRNWDAFLGRHIPLCEDCLACRFPRRDLPTSPLLTCSTGRVTRTRSADVRAMDAALPFASTTAAILALAELAKLAVGRPVNPNFACVDFRGNLSELVTENRPASSGCICADQRTNWHALNRETRFAHLSNPTPSAGGVE